MSFTTYFIYDLLVLSLALVGSIYLYYRWMYGHWKRKEIPYLTPKFPFGNLENPINRKEALGVRFNQIYDEFKTKGYKYGGMFSTGQPILMVLDPDMIRSILTKNFQHFTDRGLYSNEEVDPLSGHLFMLSGTKWRNLRTKLTPTFTSGKMKMMFSIMAECSSQLLDRVDYYARDQLPVDIKEVLACFTTDVIGSSAFGLNCNSFNEDNAAFRKYGRKLLDPSALQIVRHVFVISFPKLAGYLGVKQMNPDIENFFMNTVKKTVGYRERTKFTRNDFMQLLIDLKNSEDGSGLTMNEIAAQSFVFFVAGFETSSSAMSFCLYELSVNQDIQEKTRSEIKRVLEQHKGVMSYEAVQEMRYLAQVLDETLRKYPPLPVLSRKCTMDCKLEEVNLIIPKGQRNLISVLGLHYDPEYFPNPDKFDPDRFSDENKASIRPYTYLPFGEGPRNCIGMRFGLLQAKVGLAMLLKNFEFTLNAKTKTPVHLYSKTIALAVEGGLWLNANNIR